LQVLQVSLDVWYSLKEGLIMLKAVNMVCEDDLTQNNLMLA